MEGVRNVLKVSELNLGVKERHTMRVKVMRCYRYGNGDRMHVILNGEPLEEVDCFKYLG